MVSVIIDLIPPRDMRELTTLQVLESTLEAGPYTQIDSTTEIGVYPDYIDQFTTENAGSATNWFAVRWVDADNVVSETSQAVQGGTIASEILASLDDINGNLDGSVVKATFRNTAFIQISVARVVRGYLSRVISTSTLLSWSTPDTTPQIIREIAGKLIAAQLYFNVMSAQSLVIPDDHVAQRLYNEAMALMNGIISGEVIIDDTTVVNDTETLTLLDFHPIDDTGRAFTIGMEL